METTFCIATIRRWSKSQAAAKIKAATKAKLPTLAEAKKGDRLSVPAGVKHAFRNPTKETVRVFNTHQPALKMEEYFADVCKVLDKVTRNREQPFKMNPKTMLYMGVLMNRYRKEIVAVKPPDAAIRGTWLDWEKTGYAVWIDL